MRIMNIQRGFSIQYNTMSRWEDFVLSPIDGYTLRVLFDGLYSRGRKTAFEMDESDTREGSRILASDERILTEEDMEAMVPNEETEETYIQFTTTYSAYLRRKGESFRFLRDLDARKAVLEDVIQEYFESMIGFRNHRQQRIYLNILYLIYRDIRDISEYKSQWIAIFDAFTRLNERWEDQRQSDLMAYPPIANDQSADTPRSSIAPKRRSSIAPSRRSNIAPSRRPRRTSSDTQSILEQNFIY